MELDASLKKHLEEHIRDCEKELDDDARASSPTSATPTSTRWWRRP